MHAMRTIVRYLLAALLLASLFTLEAMAETQPQSPTAPAVKIDKRKLLVPPRNPDGSIQITPFSEDPVLWLRDQQQVYYSAMKKSMQGVASETPLAAALTLAFIAFGYGVLHAAGPGHGKAVISAWLLATESELRRGVLIAFIASIIQALTAIVVVSALLYLVASAAAAVRDVGSVLESASFAMIACVGLYLIWTALRPHVHAHALAPAPAGHPHLDGVDLVHREHHDLHDHAHHHHHDHGHQHHHDHDHHDGHDAHCGCGHSHAPEAAQVKGEWSWTKAFSLAFAVGIRPCTGAFLVLLFGYSLGIYWAGVAATFVMAFGTFLTVSAIAAIAVYSRKLALKLSSGRHEWLGRVAFFLRLGGGIAIACFGGLLFLASLGGQPTMM
jgi:ABC-type nickel/cobalt efflux system permease component RcnA